jgi:PhzF family phenazine biosynthesis protein
MPTDVFVVDAFTDRPFSGNPAGVVPLASEADPRWMQAVAAEMNLAETAFSWPEGAGFRIRWFSPLVEVALCGHATLATAAILWRTGLVRPDAAIDFTCASGVLGARRDGSAIVLDFPAKPCTAVAPPAGLADALGRQPRWCGMNGLDLLVELASEADVRTLTPDLALVARLPIRGLIVTARAEEPGWDVVSRFFCPAVGVPEDPVTGSSHCALGPFWSERLGRNVLRCRQLSRRGGSLVVTVSGERVQLAGQAVVVSEGRLLADHA